MKRRNSNNESVFLDANLLIYLNCIKNVEDRVPYEEFYYKVLESFTVFTDLLVLDELLWVSRKKYSVPYEVTIDFIYNAVLPYVNVLPIDINVLDSFFSVIRKYKLKPSDAIHLSVMKKNQIVTIVSEDKDFDSIQEFKRLWM